MSVDLQSITIRLLDLADRAGQIARGLDKQRTVRHGGRHGMASIETPARTAGVMASNDTAMHSLAQLGHVCREFERAIKASVAQLPKDMRP